MAKRLSDQDAAHGKGSGRKLVSMAVPYAIGTFNDNFFKQGAMLLALAVEDQAFQGWAAALLSLPFVIFSAWAGWLADRHAKRGIILGAKGLEILAMLLGAFALLFVSWPGMLGVIFFMGLQSTIFSPALNGSIPELFSGHDVPRVNAALKLVTTCTILLGVALAGVLLDLDAPQGYGAALGSIFVHPDFYSFGRFAVISVALAASLIGFLSALLIVKRPPACPADSPNAKPFPWLGPLDSLKDTLALGKTPELRLTLYGEAFFYFISTFVLLGINAMGVSTLKLSMTETSLLIVALMVGVCIGALLAGRKGGADWKKAGPRACLGLGLGLVLAGFAPFFPPPLAEVWLFAVLSLSGVGGGYYLIPMVSFNQMFPSAEEKGKVLGLDNFLSFSGILMAGFIYSFFSVGGWGPDLSPGTLLAASGLTSLLFALALTLGIWKLNPYADAFSLILRAILSLRYDLEFIFSPESTRKASETGKGGDGAFIFPNHPAFIDPVIVYTAFAGLKPRPFSDANQVKNGVMAWAGRVFRAITIPDMQKEGLNNRQACAQGVAAGLRLAADAVRAGEKVFLYPAGMLDHEHLERLGPRSAASRLLEELPSARVILVRTQGLWGSAFSRAATGHNPDWGKVLKKGLAVLLVNGIFFTPRRKVTLYIHEPDDLPRPALASTAGEDALPDMKESESANMGTGARTGKRVDKNYKKSLNSYLEAFYNQDAPPATRVPLFFWQGSRPVPFSDPLPKAAPETLPGSSPGE